MGYIKVFLQVFVHSVVFKIIIAVICSILMISVVMVIISAILKILFMLIKQKTFKACLGLGMCIISACYCYRYSKWGFLSVPIVGILSILCSITEKKILSKVDNVKFSVSKKFWEDYSDVWGCIYLLALLGPILTCLNVIVCEHYKMNVMEWFKFYWTFQEGIFRNEIIRYAIALLPWFVLIMPFIFLSELRKKDWLIDLGEVRKKDNLEKRNERERILQINPDADIDEHDIMEEPKYSDVEEINAQEIKDESEEDDILKEISKFI